MSFKIDHCVPSDAPAVAEAYISTYERMPRHIATFAGIPRDRQISNFTKKFEAGIESQNHPTATQEKHYLKATDPVTGELVAFATWIYLPQGYKAEEDPDATVTEIPEGANEALVRDLGPLAGNIRGEHEGRKGPHWLLNLLGTHPKHERRGAAAMLMKWGFDKADKDHKRCYVEASSVGYPLYKRCGFEDVGEIVVDLDKYCDKGFGVHRWVAMLREPDKES